MAGCRNADLSMPRLQELVQRRAKPIDVAALAEELGMASIELPGPTARAYLLNLHMCRISRLEGLPLDGSSPFGGKDREMVAVSAGPSPSPQPMPAAAQQPAGATALSRHSNESMAGESGGASVPPADDGGRTDASAASGPRSADDAADDVGQAAAATEATATATAAADNHIHWHCLALDCSLNRIASLAGLDRLQQLRKLDLSFNHVSKHMRALGHVPHLCWLSLRGNALHHVPSEVSECTALTHLDVSANSLTELGPARTLTRLVSLDASSNELATLVGVSALASLQQLRAASNRITDVADVALLPVLRALDLSDNRIEELAPTARAIVAAPALQELRLAGNPVAEAPQFRVCMAEAPHLQQLDELRLEPELRQRLAELRHESELEALAQRTVAEYVARVELERRRMGALQAMFASKQRQLETAFEAYRRDMDAEMQECTAYLRDMAAGRAPLQREWLQSEEGMRQLQLLLQREAAARAEEDSARAAAEQAAARAAVEARVADTSFRAKLLELSFKRPHVWRAIKRMELEQREGEDAAHGAQQLAALAEREAAERARRERQAERERAALEPVRELRPPADVWWEDERASSGSEGEEEEENAAE